MVSGSEHLDHQTTTENSPSETQVGESESLETVPTTGEVEERVNRLLESTTELTASWSRTFHRYDQRREHRIPHEADLLLIPVSAENELPNGDPGIVLCKNISTGGFAFYHQTPIVHRKVAILLPTATEKQELMVAKLVWCRFTRHNFYCSGAKILRKATFPFDNCWTNLKLQNW
ncbi:MAG: hypothetical protein KDA65_05930 [Planctomycetaceae bacterium]|nr:hypothetical protein [Planctomycetaceae bacterium]